SRLLVWYFSFFFFQAEDGIRDFHVTGVQTCALPIYRGDLDRMVAVVVDDRDAVPLAGAGESPFDAPEGGERRADLLVGNAELPRSEERRVGKGWCFRCSARRCDGNVCVYVDGSRARR